LISSSPSGAPAARGGGHGAAGASSWCCCWWWIAPAAIVPSIRGSFQSLKAPILVSSKYYQLLATMVCG